MLITDSDIDHIAGLLTLRERTPFTIFATGTTLEVLAGNPIFDVLGVDTVARRCVALEEPVELTAGLRAKLFSVPGKIPLFLEDPKTPPPTDAETDGTVGVELSDGRRTALYIPSCAALPAHLRSRLSGADLVFFDGTVFYDDELIRTRVGEKTGRRMGHMPIAGPDGSLAAFADIPVGRKIYIHINNTNPIWCRESPERRMVTESGWEVAADGMEVVL